jgi:hypothetical protein
MGDQAEVLQVFEIALGGAGADAEVGLVFDAGDRALIAQVGEEAALAQVERGGVGGDGRGQVRGGGRAPAAGGGAGGPSLPGAAAWSVTKSDSPKFSITGSG